MMNKSLKTILALSAWALWPGSSVASERLEPCRDVFAEPTAPAQEAIRRVLLPERTLWAKNPAARVVVLPSFEPEWVVSVYLTADASTVELRSVDTSIGTSPERENTVTSAHVTEATAPIDPALGEAIRDTWKRELLNLDPPQSHWTSDGTSFHVSAWVQGYGLLCGESSSATKEAHITARIADILRVFVNEASSRRKLEAELWRLIQESKELGCR